METLAKQETGSWGGDFRLDAELMNLDEPVKLRFFLRSLAHKRFQHWFLAGYFVVLAFIAFWPSPVDKPVASDLTALLDFLHRLGIPLWLGYGFIEASANMFLFVPAGLLLRLALPSKQWWQLLALGAALSSTVELGQMLFLPNRFSSWQDVLMNTLGVGLGLLLAALLNRQPDLRPSGKSADT